MRTLLLLGALTAGLACGKDAATGSSGTKISSIAVEQNDLQVGVGASKTITVYVRGPNLELLSDAPGLEWRSSDSTVAKVDATGSVLGVRLGGPVAISVSKDGQSAISSVTVTPSSVVVSPNIGQLQVGESVQLSAVAFDASGAQLATPPVAWTIASVTIAGSVTVSATGLLTAVSPGFAHVTATMAGKAQDLPVGVPGPFDGGWGGTNANGTAIVVTVQFGIVSAFTVPNIVIQACTTTHYSTPLSLPIIGNTFSSGPVGSAGSFNGTFSSPNSMSGSYGQITLGQVRCDAGNMLGTGLAPSTFTATK